MPPAPATAPLIVCAALLCWLLCGTAPASAQSPPASAPPATAAAHEPRFDVFEFAVQGNTVLGTQRIERAVYPFLGEGRTAADMEGARAALESAYRDEGFGTVLVDIPEQRVNSGVVVLNVTEAAVSRLRVVGARYHSQEHILSQVPGVAEGQVPHFPTVTAQLAEVNRTAERRVTPLLRPGRAPGTTEVDLNVEDRLPLSGSLELNNRQSPDTTPTRLVAGLRYGNLWQRDHAIALQAQVSPEDTSEVKVFALSYTVPDGEASWAFSFIRSDSSVLSSVGGTNVVGKGNIYGIRRNLPVKRGDDVLGTASFGADYKDLIDTVRTRSDEGDAGFSTPISYLPLSASVALFGRDTGGSWQGGTGLVFAIRDLTGDQQQFADKRYRGDASFAILKFDFAREQTGLPADTTLYAKVEGQLTDRPLVSNEQLSAGGVDSVRGYLESAAVGDYGLRASLEWRSANLAREAWAPFMRTLRLHAFFEGAGVWLRSPLPGQDPRAGLLGAGVGLRMQAGEHGAFNLDAGWPLRALGNTERGELRIHGSGVLSF